MKLKYCLLYLTSSFTGFFLQDLVGDTTQACDGNGWDSEIGLKVCQVSSGGLFENDGMIRERKVLYVETWKISSYLVATWC